MFPKLDYSSTHLEVIRACLIIWLITARSKDLEKPNTPYSNDCACCEGYSCVECIIYFKNVWRCRNTNITKTVGCGAKNNPYYIFEHHISKRRKRTGAWRMYKMFNIELINEKWRLYEIQSFKK